MAASSSPTPSQELDVFNSTPGHPIYINQDQQTVAPPESGPGSIDFTGSPVGDQVAKDDPLGAAWQFLAHPVSTLEGYSKAGDVQDMLDPLAAVGRAEEKNVYENDATLETMRTITGDTLYQQHIKSLEDEREGLTAKILGMSSNPILKAQNSSLLDSYSSQVTAINNTILHTPRPVTTWEGLKEFPKALFKHPVVTVKNMLNQFAGSPELLLGGEAVAAGRAGEAALDASRMTASAAKAGEGIVKAANAVSKLSSAFKASGVLGDAAFNAAVWTPVNVIQAYDQTGTAGMSDVVRGVVGGMFLGTMLHTTAKLYTPDVSLSRILNDAAGNGRSLAESAQVLGIDTDKTTKAAVESAAGKTRVVKPSKAAPGVDLTEITVPSSQMAGLQAAAKAGATYNVDDLIDPQISHAVLNGRLRDGLESDAAVAEHGPLKDGLTQAGPFLVHQSRTISGRVGSLVKARETPDSVSVFHTYASPTNAGATRIARSMGSVADAAIARGKLLTSSAAIDAGENAVWQRLASGGYEAQLSEHALYDPQSNGWRTDNGMPVWTVSGKINTSPDMVTLYNGGPSNKEVWTSDQQRAQSYSGDGHVEQRILPTSSVAHLQTVPGSDAYADAVQAGHTPSPEDYYFGKNMDLLDETGADKAAQSMDDVKEISSAILKQAGRINPKVLLGLGLTTAAAAYGYKQGGISGAIEDGLVAGLGSLLGPAIVRSGLTYRASRKFGELGPNDESLTHLRNLSKNLNALPLHAMRIGTYINSTLDGDTDNLYHNLVKHPDAQPMTANEHGMHDFIRRTMDHYGALAKKNNIIKEMVNDYFTRWWKPVPGSPLEANWSKVGLRNSRTLAEGRQAFEQAAQLGLEPMTKNVGDLVAHYIAGMGRAVLMKEGADTLKELKLPEGASLIQPSLSAPKHYLPIYGAQFNNMRAAPDAAIMINMLYKYADPGMLGHYYDVATSVAKRGLFGFSLFHPKSLAMNNLMATWSMPDTLRGLAPHPQFKAAFEGDTSELSKDIADSAKRVTYAVNTTPEDLDSEVFYTALNKLSDKLDSIMPHAGSLPRAFKNVAKVSDHIAFDHAQNYFKYNLYHDIYTKNWQAALNKHSLNPARYPAPVLDDIKDQAGVVANDMFGSQNYYMMVDQMRPGFMKHAFAELFNPVGRRGLQRIMLAPDWTISVARGFTGILRKNAGPARAAYGRYLGGALAMTLAAAGAQYMVTGTYPWQTHDFGYMDDLNGDKIQWDKQVAEAYEYVHHPAQAALNKLGPIPRIAAEDLFNKQYLSVGAHAPAIYKKGDNAYTAIMKLAGHDIATSLPIGLQQGSQEGLRGLIGSEVGYPMYKAHPRHMSVLATPRNEFDKYNRYTRPPKFKSFGSPNG